MPEVVRSGRRGWVGRTDSASGGEGQRQRRARDVRMHLRGLPNRFGDWRNGVVPGPPLPVGFARVVRVAVDQARVDAGHRADVAGRDRARYRARTGIDRPEQGGQADREEEPATHEPILTGDRDAVKSA